MSIYSFYKIYKIIINYICGKKLKIHNVQYNKYELHIYVLFIFKFYRLEKSYALVSTFLVFS